MVVIMEHEGYEASVRMLLNIKKHTSVCILCLTLDFNLTITLTILWSHDDLKHLIS